MKKSEINLEQVGYHFSCNVRPARSHYKTVMRLGRIFPSTKAQADHFIKNGLGLDVLNSKDVELVEALLNKHGFEGDYKYTKSRTWVRLQNQDELHEALKKEYCK